MAKVLTQEQDPDKFVDVVVHCGLNDTIPASMRAEFTRRQVLPNLSKIKSTMEPSAPKAKEGVAALILSIKEKFSPSPQKLSEEGVDKVKDALAGLYAHDVASNPYLSKGETGRLFRAVEGYLDPEIRNALGHVLGLHSK